ncbi:MAG: DUF1801 domain-containing protein [Candidatus Aminicenantes bacterium]|nr:DUF1801 domain-containing protein [Candidatus Aminicenantes bacterium]
MENNKIKSMNEYIVAFPKDVRKILRELRAAIKAVAPGAGETISYGIPTFFLNGNLVHFAAYKKHIGFYPTSSGIRTFKKELSPYKTSTGTVQFPIDKPLPLALIKKMVRFRVVENKKKYKEKTKRKK